MQDDTSQTNAIPDTPTDAPADDAVADQKDDQAAQSKADEAKTDSSESTESKPEAEATPEVTPEPAQAEAPATAEEQPKEASDVDMEEYWQQRYQAPQETTSQGDDLTKSLSELPTDEYGTAEPEAVAKWLGDFQKNVETRAEQRAIQRAEAAAMGVVSESAQQQQLLKKYPEVTQDKDLLDDIFDLRDAAALKGNNVSLLTAADRILGRVNAAKGEGREQANKSTTIAPSTHLETSAVRSTGNADREIAVKAVSGTGSEADDARRQLLTKMVEKEIEEGRIQPS